MDNDERRLLERHIEAMHQHCVWIETFTNSIESLLRSKKLDNLNDALENLPHSIQIELEDK